LQVKVKKKVLYFLFLCLSNKSALSTNHKKSNYNFLNTQFAQTDCTIW